MMLNVVLSHSVEIDTLVIVFVRSVVGFRSGCVTSMVSIDFSLARIIAFLVAFGWYDSACSHNCFMVGLICVLKSKIFSLKCSPLYSVMYKKMNSSLLDS